MAFSLGYLISDSASELGILYKMDVVAFESENSP